jgi:hypothetical protein
VTNKIFLFFLFYFIFFFIIYISKWGVWEISLLSNLKRSQIFLLIDNLALVWNDDIVVHLNTFLECFVLRSQTVSLHVWKHSPVSFPYLDFYSRSETEFLIENDFRTLNSPRIEFSRQFIPYVLAGNIHKKWNIPANLYHMFWRETFTRN